MEKIVVLSKEEIIEFVKNLHPNPVVGVLLAGDRLLCVTEAVGIEIEGKMIGIATIAEEGELYSGDPTLVALYIKPEHRQKGYGKKLLKEAISYAKKKFPYLRVDILSSKVKKMIQSLPEEDKKFLKIFDPGASTGFYPLDYFPE